MPEAQLLPRTAPLRHRLRGCTHCGLVLQVPAGTSAAYACVRCGARLLSQPARHWSRDPAVAFAAAALVLYFPAILLPILEVERLGRIHDSSLLGGTLELFRHGDWFVGGVVLLFSIVLPLLKLLGIIELSVAHFSPRQHRGWLHQFVEMTGRWGMLDVLLLALLVMAVKVGELIEFQFGPAVIAFTACVFCNLLASFSFDPHTIWQSEESA